MNNAEYKSLENKGEDMAKAVKHLWNFSQDEALQEYINAFDKRERYRISAKNSALRGKLLLSFIQETVALISHKNTPSICFPFSGFKKFFDSTFKLTLKYRKK